MSRLFQVILILLFICCNGNNPEAERHKTDNANKAVTDSKKSIQQNEANSWIDNFRKFRTAIYENDRKTVKTFIDFPIMNENNEMWELVEPDKTYNPSDSLIKPFTEQDFDKYFHKIFPKKFVNTILKIKTAELSKNGQYRTVDFSEGKSTVYYMYATYDKPGKQLNLILGTSTYHDDIEGGETIGYMFKVLNDGEIRFYQVRSA